MLAASLKHIHALTLGHSARWLDQWGKGAVEKQHAVFGVIHDVDQLLGMQSHVAGVISMPLRGSA